MWSSSRRASLPTGAVFTVAAAFTLAWGPARAAVDLSALEVVPQRGQSAEQARRDRYECHNWAVEQTGTVPRVAPTREEKPDTDHEKRAERVGRAIAGAAIGASLGGLVGVSRHRRNDADTAVLTGAAVGAAVGAATAKSADERGKASEDAKAPDDDYLRALTACLEGRGYSVSLPE